MSSKEMHDQYKELYLSKIHDIDTLEAVIKLFNLFKVDKMFDGDNFRYIDKGDKNVTEFIETLKTKLTEIQKK